MQRVWISALIVGASIAFVWSGLPTASPHTQSPQRVPAARGAHEKCGTPCHNQRARTAGLALDSLDVSNPSANAETWEKVIQKLRAGSMPPPGNPRPDVETYRAT